MNTKKCTRKEYVTPYKTCVECDCEMKYCKDCRAYHHTDSFNEEHIEFQEKLDTVEDEDVIVFRGKKVRDFGRPIDGEY